MDPVVELMIGILRDKFAVTRELTADSDVNEIGLDSLDVINFLFSVEEKTGVPIPDTAIAAHRLRTLSSFAAYIAERQPRTGGTAASATP